MNGSGGMLGCALRDAVRLFGVGGALLAIDVVLPCAVVEASFYKPRSVVVSSWLQLKDRRTWWHAAVAHLMIY
jgi:hypothetical protein